MWGGVRKFLQSIIAVLPACQGKYLCTTNVQASQKTMVTPTNTSREHGLAPNLK